MKASFIRLTAAVLLLSIVSASEGGRWLGLQRTFAPFAMGAPFKSQLVGPIATPTIPLPALTPGQPPAPGAQSKGIGPSSAPASAPPISPTAAQLPLPLTQSPGPLTDLTQLVVGIVFNGNNEVNDPQICSGTLIDPTHVLTAGHCGCGDPTSYRVYTTNSVYPPGMSTIEQAGLGQTYYRSKPPAFYDQKLCGTAQFRGNDLALLELRQTFSQVPPMNFGNPVWALLQEIHIGQRMLVFGYGYNNQNTVGTRYQDSIPIESVACTEPSLAPYCAPFAEMILGEPTGTSSRDDTCGGDSGGPVFRSNGGNYELIAVTSRSAPGVQDNPLKNCGGGGIYTIVGRESVQQWLQANGAVPATWVRIASP